MGVLFSVVIPVYNKRRHLQECLDSVRRQTCRDYEIIIIDDNSSDGSYEYLLDACADDDNITLIRREKPGPGGYAARNAGITLSKGRWIAFLDADDQWTPEHLSNMARLVDAYPGAACLSSGWMVTSPDGKFHSDRYYQKRWASGDHLLTLSEYLHLCTMKMRPCFTSVFCVRNGEPFLFSLFPEGRGNKGGDLYAFLKGIVASGCLAWSSRIGAIYNPNADNRVSRQPFHSVGLFVDMKYEFRERLTPPDQALLRKFINRTLFYAWNRDKVFGLKAYSVLEILDFRSDPVFCLYALCYSVVPNRVVFALKSFRKVNDSNV